MKVNQSIRGFAAFLIAILPGAVLGQTVVYVDADATGVNDGTSWQNAFTDLQDGIALATAGTQIWVAEGTYRPAGPSGDRTSSFVLRPGVEVYGGFVGNESSVDERPSPLAVTTLSGDLLGNDGDEISLDDPTRAENSFHVVRCGESDSETPSILDGFVVTGGNANGSPSPSELKAQGGGIQCVERLLHAANLLLTRNSAGSGGGLFASGSDIVIRSSSFRANVAGGGGGLYLFVASGILDDVSFYENQANQEGGGLNIDNASLFASNLIVQGNRGRGGGGIRTRHGTQWIVNANVAGNLARSGAGVDCSESHLTLTNALIDGNSASGEGVGEGYGGGFYAAGCTFLGVNLTVVHNSASSSGAAAANAGGEQTYVNSIFWGNRAAADGMPFSDDGIGSPDPPSATVSFSALEGGLSEILIDGGRNSGDEPIFVDAFGPDSTAGTLDDDLRQVMSSPHIDTGSNAALTADSLDLDDDGDRMEPVPFDLDGDPRVIDGGSGQAVVDLGCYELEVVSNAFESAGEDPTADSALDISAYPNPFSSRAWVSIQSSERDYVSVTVYDLLGRSVATLFSGVLSPFDHKTLTVPTHLPAGRYVIVARGERSSTSLPVAKVHK